jgi:hypothetical protein
MTINPDLVRGYPAFNSPAYQRVPASAEAAAASYLNAANSFMNQGHAHHHQFPPGMNMNVPNMMNMMNMNAAMHPHQGYDPRAMQNMNVYGAAAAAYYPNLMSPAMSMNMNVNAAMRR